MASASEVRKMTELDTFYEMVEDIGIAMMTTRRPDGHLESRAMANQKRAAGADLWFVTAEGTGKLRSLEADPHINLSYYKDRTREWISVSGLATISRDRQKSMQPDFRTYSKIFPVFQSKVEIVFHTPSFLS